MNIHLSKPGGQREGPFTVEQINRALAAKKYQDTDYWAWHEGLTEWVPLHSVPGITPAAGMLRSQSSEREVTGSGQPAETEVMSAVASDTAAVSCAVAPAVETAPPPETEDAPEETSPPLREQLSSGMQFAALEEILMLTMGEGQSTSRSEVTTAMLEAVTGEELQTVRQQVPRRVLAHCDFLGKLREGGPLPETAWRALAKLNPQLVQQAREGLFRVCVRSYPVETGEMASLFFFYNKQKL